jgi:hypothetical protein
MYIWYLVVAAFIGGLFAALLGWLESGEPFVARKFASSIMRALLASAVFAIGYTVTPVLSGIFGVIAAFLAGAGVDVIGNRLAGSVKASQSGTTSPPKV